MQERNDRRYEWLDRETSAWLDAFEKEHGRPLRVLHVGNIANNAYLNAKFLRMVGVEADVLSHDYNDPFALPEWEEAPFETRYQPDGTPDWSTLTTEGYRRPSWFFNGPFVICAARVDLRHLADGKRPWTRWIKAVWWMPVILRELTIKILSKRLRTMPTTRRLVRRIKGARSYLRRPKVEVSHGVVDRFGELFPDRHDTMTSSDLDRYSNLAGVWRQMFRHYDAIQAYATQPASVYIAGERRYVAYEHGTLRDFTMGDSPVHRLTSLAYREAAHVFITNGDCFAYADKLGITRASPMIHPLDVDLHETARGNRDTLLDAYGADILLVCPIRHDWAVKGIDVHLRALPALREQITGRFKLVLFRWGKEVDRSRGLVEELGCEDLVAWTDPLGRQALVRYLAAADVVLDQMTLPHFGGTAPQALAAGTPAIMSYEPESTSMIAAEPAPILTARTPAEVVRAVQTALDPTWRTNFRIEAARWMHRYHHPRRIVNDHLRAYGAIVDGTPTPRKAITG